MKSFIVHFHRNLKTILMFTILIFHLNCSEKKHIINYQDIRIIKIGYLPPNINTYVPVDIPEEITMYEQTKYKQINDSNFFCNLANCINNLQISDKTDSHNYRIICYIYFKNKNIPPCKLYLGENHEIVYNDKQMKYNKELFDLFAPQVGF